MTETSSEPPAPEARSGLLPFVAGAVLLLGAGVFAYSVLGGGGGGEGGGPPAPRGRMSALGGKGGARPVEVIDVEVGALRRERRVPGEVFVLRRAALRARTEGIVRRLPYRLGEAVAKGALVVGLDTGTLGPELERARALTRAALARKDRAALMLQQAQREKARREDLRTQGAVSVAELERARTDVALAEADLSLAEAEVARSQAEEATLQTRLAMTRLVAPFDGRVARVLVEEGSVVTPGTLLVELVADESPRVRFSVGESEARTLALGAPIVVRYAGRQIEGEVAAIGAAIDAESRTLPVEATLKVEPSPVGGSRLLPGAFVEVEVALGATEDALVVPLGALKGEGPVREVFVVEEGKVRAVQARVLLEDGERAAIEGVKEGQKVVVGGVEGLADGADVEVVQ